MNQRKMNRASQLIHMIKRWAQPFNNAVVALPWSWFMGLHASISAIAAVGLLPLWSSAFANFSDAQANLKLFGKQRYFPWIQPYYFPNHKFTIFAFVVTVGTLGLVVLASTLLAAHGVSAARKSRRPLIVATFVAAVIVFVEGFSAAGGAAFRPIEIGLINLGLLGAVAWPQTSVWLPQRKAADTNGSLNFAIFAMTLAALELTVLCIYCGSGQQPIASDFMQIPSSTFVRDGAGSPGRYVDTIDYINDNYVWGNQLIPDMRRYATTDPPCLVGNYFDLPRGPVTEELVASNRYTFYFHYPDGKLCFVGKLEPAPLLQLIETMSSYRDQIGLVSAQNNEIWRKYYSTPWKGEITDFGYRNKVPFINFIHDLEQTFHHHFQILNPIKEHTLGRPLRDINAAYGLNFIAVEALMKIVGGVSYNSFIAVMFALQLIYVATMAAIFQWLYRDWRTTSIVVCTYTACITGLGVATVSIGLGYGPVRHFLDVGVLFIFALYLKKGSLPLVLWAAGLAALNIFADRFVGAFCPVALAATLILRGIAGRGTHPRAELTVGSMLLGLVALGFVKLGGMLADNPYAEQFLDGVWGFPVGVGQLTAFTIYVALALSVAIWSGLRLPRETKSLPVYLAIYTLMFVLYWLMVPNYGHLYKILPLAILTIVVLWHECLSELCVPRVQNFVMVAGIALVCFLWLNMSRYFAVTVADSVRYLSSAQLYDWTFPRLKARSTMSPAPFQEAVALIQRYSTNSTPVSIISEFDSLLLFLSDRVSAMPHFELATYLNSPQHLDNAIEDVRKRQPEFLIVDSCIRCSAVPYHLTRLVPYLDVSYIDRTVDKVDRLQRLREVFAAIGNDYEPIPGASSQMVTIYRRVPGMSQTH